MRRLEPKSAYVPCVLVVLFYVQKREPIKRTFKYN